MSDNSAGPAGVGGLISVYSRARRAISFAARSGYRGRLIEIATGRIAIAIGWNTTAMIVGQVIRLVSSLIMTRLLAPEMFGIMSIVMSIQITLTLLLDVGIRAAVIHSPRGNDPEMLNTAWTMQIIRGAAITILIILLAISLPFLGEAGFLPAGTTWSEPQLPLILGVASLTALVSGFESTNTITAERSIALKRYTYLNITCQVVGFISVVLLGILTRSIWALVIGGILSSLTMVVLSHIIMPGIRNQMAWHRESRRELVKYGSWILISSIAYVLSSQADRLILGGLIDPATLGLYSIAINLALLVEMLLSSCIGSVMMPALSEAARDSGIRFRDKYFRLRTPIDAAMLFCAGGLFAASPLAIDILYDHRYLAAGGMLQILSLSLIFARHHFAGASFMALGKPNYLAIMNFAKFFSLIILLGALYQLYGFDGALYAIALHMAPILLLVHWFNRSCGIGSIIYELLITTLWLFGYLTGTIFVEIIQIYL